MPYRYLTFDGLALPTRKPTDDLSSAQSESAIVQALNGVVDTLGNVQANAKVQTLEYGGMYKASEFNVLDPGLLITGDGFFLVTEDGDFLVESVTGTKNIVDAWRQRRGVRSLLVRERESDGVQSWAWARLMQFELKRSVEDADAVARVRLVFEIADSGWRSMTPTTVTAALASGGLTVALADVLVTVSSDVVIDDCVIEVEATSPYITDIIVSKLPDSELIYDSLVSPFAYSPIYPGDFAQFDCGRFTFTYGGTTTLYHLFSLGVSHVNQGWITLQPGDNTVSFAVTFSSTGGTGTVRIRYYEREA